jgi:hypothetical protein
LIRDALLGGHPVPQDLQEKVLAKLSAGKATATAVGASQTKWIMLAGGTAALLAFVYWFASHSGQPAPIAPIPVQAAALTPPAPPESSSVIYEDEFSKAVLDPFWVTRCEPGWLASPAGGQRQAKPSSISGSGPEKSWLTLEAKGVTEDGKPGVVNLAELISKPIPLGEQQLYLEMDGAIATGKDSFEYGIEIFDETGRTIAKQSILSKGLEPGKYEAQTRYQSWSYTGDTVKLGTRRVLSQLPKLSFRLGFSPTTPKVKPDDKFTIQEASTLTSAFVGDSPHMESVRIRLFLKVESGATALWAINNMKVSRKGEMPKLNPETPTLK